MFEKKETAACFCKFAQLFVLTPLEQNWYWFILYRNILLSFKHIWNQENASHHYPVAIVGRGR